MYEVSDKRKQTNYFLIFICIKNISFSIRIIKIRHFFTLTTWFWMQNFNSSGLICFLDQSYCKKNSDFILFYSRNIALSIYNPTIPFSIHHIFFSNIIHMTSIRQNKAHIFIFVCKKDFIDSSIHFPLLLLPMFGPTHRISQYCNLLELININMTILMLQVKPTQEMKTI